MKKVSTEKPELKKNNKKSTSGLFSRIQQMAKVSFLFSP